MRLADLRSLHARLGDGVRVAVLGAGLIGMELAEALVHRGRGVRVTVIEQERQVLPRSFDAELAGEIAALFESRGVTLRLGQRATALERTGAGVALALSDGSAEAADLDARIPLVNFVGGLAGADLRRELLEDAVRTTVARGRGEPGPEVVWLGLG